MKVSAPSPPRDLSLSTSGRNYLFGTSQGAHLADLNLKVTVTILDTITVTILGTITVTILYYYYTVITTTTATTRNREVLQLIGTPTSPFHRIQFR
jgi:hypothetical protein